MLIEIDGSAIDDALRGSERSRECIENFLRAHDRSKHVVWLDRGRIQTLGTLSPGFSGPARNALRNIRAQEHEILALSRRMRWSIKVGRGAAFQGAVTLEAGREVIHADLHHFHDDERSGRAVLLGEHLRDADLYVAMGRAFAAARGWRVELNFEERLGGGGTTAAVFDRLVRDGRIVLAIVDSDRRYPGGPLGGTAQSARAVACTPLQHLHVIHVRTAENLVSSAVYAEVFAGDPRKRDAIAVLAPPWRDHADIKDGLKLTALRAMATGSEAAFWSGVAVSLGRDQCLQTPRCGGGQGCQCYVIGGLGREALPSVVEWLTSRDRARNARLLGLVDLPHGAPLGDLCEKIVAWGLSLRR